MSLLSICFWSVVVAAVIGFPSWWMYGFYKASDKQEKGQIEYFKGITNGFPIGVPFRMLLGGMSSLWILWFIAPEPDSMTTVYVMCILIPVSGITAFCFYAYFLRRLEQKHIPDYVSPPVNSLAFWRRVYHVTFWTWFGLIAQCVIEIFR